MTLVRNSLMSDIGPRRAAVYTMGERVVDTFDPVIAIPATEPSTALHSWTYTAAMLPTVTTCHSFVRAPVFNIHVYNTAGVAVALSYRMKVNGVDAVTGSLNTHATYPYTTLLLGFAGEWNMVVGDVVELFLWCDTAGMDLTSSILDTYATRLFFHPRSAGVYRAMLLPQFVDVAYPDGESGFVANTLASFIYLIPNNSIVSLSRVNVSSSFFPALFPHVDYGVFQISYGDGSPNRVGNILGSFTHFRGNHPASIEYSPMVLDIESLLT